jgi:hypothetical protein
MITSRRLVVALWLAAAACTLSRSDAQTAICEFPPVVGTGWYDWIYDPGVPASARRELLPLYEQLDLLQRLRLPVALLQMQDLAWQFLAAAGAAVNSKASVLVAESATGKTRPGNAATSADSPEALGWDIGSDIRDLESQIKTVRHKYKLDTTVGPVAKPFDISSVFSNDGVKTWLQKSDCGQKLLQRTVQPEGTAPHDSGQPSEKAYTDAINAANNASQACYKTLNACIRACGYQDGAGKCIAGCGNCNSEDAAFLRAQQQLADFVTRQAKKAQQ